MPPSLARPPENPEDVVEGVQAPFPSASALVALESLTNRTRFPRRATSSMRCGKAAESPQSARCKRGQVAIQHRPRAAPATAQLPRSVHCAARASVANAREIGDPYCAALYQKERSFGAKIDIAPAAFPSARSSAVSSAESSAATFVSECALAVNRCAIARVKSSSVATTA